MRGEQEEQRQTGEKWEKRQKEMGELMEKNAKELQDLGTSQCVRYSAVSHSLYMYMYIWCVKAWACICGKCFHEVPTA